MACRLYRRGGMSAATVLFLLTLMVGAVDAQQSVSITSGEVTGLGTATLRVLLTSDALTEGYVLAIGYDSDEVSVANVDVSGQVVRSSEDRDDCDDGTNSADQTCAELVVAEIFDDEGGFTIGVVLDTTPNAGGGFDGQTIPIGTDLEIASFDVTADGLLGPTDDPREVEFTFADGEFNSPILDNILVQEGRSISIVDDMDSFSGTLTLIAPAPDSMAIEGDYIAFGGTGTAKVLLSNSSGAVQGFVTAIAHNGDELSLTNIDVSAAVDDIGAEFVESSIFDDGGTLGVVLDFVQDFDGQTIPVGADNHIADYTYRCDLFPGAGEPFEPSSDLEFVDGTLGSPALDNVIVIEGLSLGVDFNNGSMTCQGFGGHTDTEFLLGDRDGNDLTGFPGSQLEVCVSYNDLDSNIQGLSIAMVTSAGLSFVEGSFSIDGTIVDEVGAEFVNENTDGDEMTIAILLDALPPFDDQTLPPTLGDELLLGCFEVLVADDADCDDVFEVEFQDGIKAGKSVPVNNLIVIDFESLEGFLKFGTTISIDLEPTFSRGDCNLDTRVNLADPATVLGYNFQDLDIACEDSCDANDDGKINLADSVFLLNYLFKDGAPPKAPFPESGSDDTEDELGCEAGDNPCA